jgi:hypothetical protein
VYAFFVAFLLICCALTVTVHARNLSHVFWALLILQAVVAVARMAPGLTPAFLLEAYHDIRFAVFDAGGFVRPGCEFFRESFTQVFFVTLVVLFLFSLAFILGPLAYGALCGRLDKFRRRTVRHICIFSTSTYYIITLRAFQAINCTRVRPLGESLLVGELGTVCYTGGHLAAAIVAYCLLIVYCIPLPFVTGYLLWRHESRLDDASVSPLFGFLYETFDPRAYLAAPIYLGSMLYLAIVDAMLTPWPPAQFALCIALFAAIIAFCVWRRPFAVHWELVLCCATAVVALFGSLVNMLASFEAVPRALIWVLGIVHLISIAGLLCGYGMFLFRHKADATKALDVQHKDPVVYQAAIPEGNPPKPATTTTTIYGATSASALSALPVATTFGQTSQPADSLRFTSTLGRGGGGSTTMLAAGKTKTAQQLVATMGVGQSSPDYSPT